MRVLFYGNKSYFKTLGVGCVSVHFLKEDKYQYNLKYYALIKEEPEFKFYEHSILFTLDIGTKNTRITKIIV